MNWCIFKIFCYHCDFSGANYFIINFNFYLFPVNNLTLIWYGLVSMIFYGWQVNAISCSTCWKILLFMEYKEDRDDVLKGVRSQVKQFRVLQSICFILCRETLWGYSTLNRKSFSHVILTWMICMCSYGQQRGQHVEMPQALKDCGS